MSVRVWILVSLAILISHSSVQAGIGEAVEFNFGRVVLGNGTEETWTACEDHPETFNYVGQATHTGSTDFQIISDTCSGSTVGPGQCCSVTVRFTPSSLTPLKTQPKKAFFSIYNLERWEPATPPPPGQETEWEEELTLTVSGEGVPALLPVIQTCVGSCAGAAISTVPSAVPANSSINIHTLALEEQIPLVGVPFSLSYTSDLRRIRLEPKVFGLGGWVPSVMHYYNPEDKILYLGYGPALAVEARPLGTGYYIVSPSGKEVYFFNQQGIHTETRETLQGLLVYSFTYQSEGKISSIADRFSNQTTFSYVGNAVTVTSPYGQSTELTLDNNGFLASLVNPLNETWLFQHNSYGLLLAKTKPQGQTSQITYDEFGFVKEDLGHGGDFLRVLRLFNSVTGKQNVTLTTAEGRQTQFESTAENSTASSHKMISSSGYVLNDARQSLGIQSSSDSTGVVSSSSVLPNPRFGVMSSYSSESSIQVPGTALDIKTATSLDAVLSAPSDPLSPLISLTETTILQNNPARTFRNIVTVETGNRLKREFISPLNRKVTENYNASGMLENLQAGDFTPVMLSYDVRGRLTETTQGVRRTQVFYSGSGNIEKVTNPLNQDTLFSYDGANRVTQKIFPDLRTVQYAYDKNGNVVSITTPKNIIHTFGLNGSELVSIYAAPPAPGNSNYSTTYEYSLDNQIKKIIRPGNDPISFEYSAMTGVVNKVVTPSGNYNIVTDPVKGLPTLISNPSGLKTQRSYVGPFISKDELLDSQDQVLGSYERVFNGDVVASDMVRGADGKGTSVSYQYDNDGNIIQAGDLTLTYNQNGQIYGTSIGAGVSAISDSYIYNSFGEVTEYEVKRGAVTLYKLNLARDVLGRITQKTQFMRGSTTVWDYIYDSSGRLTDVTKDGAAYAQYIYDANGNRIGGFIGPQTTTASYDSHDRLVSYNSFNYTYKPNGFLFKRTNTVTGFYNYYMYDSLGNLKKYYNGDVPSIVYDHDGLDRVVGRYSKGHVFSRWIYKDRYHIAGQLSETGVLSHRFVYGSKSNVPDYMISGNQIYRIISDHLGSPRIVFRVSDGALISWLDHDEFGRILGSYNAFIPFGFAGGFWNLNNPLVRFGARDYDPEVGRWTSKDPILFGGQDTNLYGYVFQDPVNFIDPSGLLFENIIAKYTTPKQQAAIGAATGAVGAALMYGSFNPFAGVTFSIGAYLGYEGSANVIKASKRGFVNDIMDDIIPRAEAGEKTCPQGN